MDWAKSSGVSAMKQFTPFCAGMPAAPSAVDTTGKPEAMASSTLIRNPEPSRMGLMNRVAFSGISFAGYSKGHPRWRESVIKYVTGFDGTAGTTTTILASTHGLGLGPFNISVYENRSKVYTEEEFNASGDITLSWTAGSLTDCSVFVTA